NAALPFFQTDLTREFGGLLGDVHLDCRVPDVGAEAAWVIDRVDDLTGLQAADLVGPNSLKVVVPAPGRDDASAGVATNSERPVVVRTLVLVELGIDLVFEVLSEVCVVVEGVIFDGLAAEPRSGRVVNDPPRDPDSLVEWEVERHWANGLADF